MNKKQEIKQDRKMMFIAEASKGNQRSNYFVPYALVCGEAMPLKKLQRR